MISPRRLHLTLGVMSLDLDDHLDPSTSGTRPRTLEAAVRFLNELKPRVMEMLAGHKLLVGLNLVDIMRPERGDLEKAHVLWTGPSNEGEDARRLRDVSSKFACFIQNVGEIYSLLLDVDFVHREFKNAGFVVDENRPLKVSCQIYVSFVDVFEMSTSCTVRY